MIDLDTIASALGYAWYREQYGAQGDHRKTIALVPTPHTDFYLRPENIYALALAGTPQHSKNRKDQFKELFCSDDLPVSHTYTNYALVDHNVLDDRYLSPNARVVAIIDHHHDEGKYRDTAYPRIIEQCGSCASLLTDLYMSRHNSDNHTQILPELAALLLSAITVDTEGLWKDGKAREIDHAAATWLLPYAEMAPKIASTFAEEIKHGRKITEISEHPLIHCLADTLHSEKIAISHLNTRDLLRRDYKHYTLQPSSFSSQRTTGTIQAGLSTVSLQMSTFLKSDLASVAADTVKWMKERGLSILGVLITYRNESDKKKRKQLWIVDERNYKSRDRLTHVLFHGLETEEALLLKRVYTSWYADGSKDDDENEDDHKGKASSSYYVESFPFKDGFVSRAYKQKNTCASRKQIAPILRQIVEG